MVEVVFSFEVGYRKPEKEIFMIALEKLKLKPEECIFIDDREKFLQTPRELGFKVILFKNYTQFVKDLKERGVHD